MVYICIYIIGFLQQLVYYYIYKYIYIYVICNNNVYIDHL